MSLIMVLTLVPMLFSCTTTGEGGDSSAEESSAAPVVVRTPAELLIGTWGFDLDFSKAANAAYEALGMKGLVMESVILPLVFEFKADGTATMSVEEGKADAFVADYVDKSVKAFEAYMLKMLKDSGQEATIDDIYQALGQTKEEYAKSIADSMDTSDFESSQKYVLKDNKIYMYDEANNETLNENEYVVMEVSEMELKFTEYHTDKEGEEFFDGMVDLPLTLIRK